MKSKGIALALLLTMIISIMSATAFATEFTDMPNNWSTASLEKAAINGLLKGNNGKIMPNDNLTRAQMAAVVNRAFGTKEKAEISSFKDVSSNSWYYDDMTKAVQMKTFMGSGNKLNPNNNITREEAFVVLARAIKLEGASESVLKKFTDYELVSQWASDGVASLVSAGYVSGSNGKLNPKDSITRAEFAKIMDNLIKSYINEEGTYATVAEGNIMVQVPNVTLKDLTVKGDLIIGDGVGDGDVTLDNITVTGRLVIRGGGENSIRIIGNSDIQNIVIARIGGVVRVSAENGIEIGKVIVDGSDDVTIEGHMRVVIVTAADITVNAINSDVDNATIEGENSRIIVASSSNMGTVNLDAPNTKVELLGKVTQINTTEKAIDALISISSKAIAEEIVAEGEGTTIEGKGIVKTVAANADSVEVNTVNTKLTAGKGTVGVTGIDENVKAGNTIITGEVKRESSGGSSSGGSDEINVNAITVSGVTRVGQLLTATFANSQNPTVTYKWQYSLDGITYNVIDGAISRTYTIAEGYVGKFIKVSATGTGRYTGTVQSAATSSIEKANTLVTVWPTVSDITYGELLTNSMITNGTSSVPGTFNFDETAILTAGNHNMDVTFIPTDAVNYNSASGNVMVSVNPKMLTETATVNDKVYDGYTNSTGTVSLSGIVGTDDVTASGTFAFASKNVGTDTIVNITNITLDGDDKNNYTVNETTTATANIIAKVVTATPSADNKTYDGSTTATGKVSITDIVAGDVVYASATFAFDNKDAGTGKIVRVVTLTITGADAGNYTVNSTTTATADINKREITITPDDLSKTYGGSDPVLTYDITVGSLVGSESLTGEVTRVSGENAGTYYIKQGTLDNNSNINYNLTFVDGIFTINKAPLNLAANDKSKVYGEDDPVLDNIVSGTLYYSDNYSLVSGVQLSTNTGPNATVGTHKITASGGIADNYYIETYVPGTLTVSKALLNVKSNNASKVYGSEEPMLSYTVSGLKYEDSESVISGIRLSTNTGYAAIVGEHTIIGSGGTAANYTITYSNGTLDVAKKELTIIGISGVNKVYDGTTSASSSGTPVLFGLVYNDQVTLGGMPIYTFASLDANKGIMISTTGFALVGDRADNYELTQPTLSADITPATPVKVSMPTSKNNVTYGASLTEAEITGGLFTFKDANGVTKEVEGAFEFVEGGFIPPAGNYGAFVIFTPTSLNFATVTPDAKVNVTVNPRAITITADNISKVYGTTDPVLTWKITQGALLNGDSFNGTLTRESGENVSVEGYAINKGTLANQNYDILVVPGKFTITPATAKLDTTPTTSPIIYGQSLSNSSFTGGLIQYGEEIVIGTFSFVNHDDIPTSIGIYHYASVKFTPSSNNYKSVSEFNVDVVVNPIQYDSNTTNNYRIDVNNGTSEETALNTLTLTYPTVAITGTLNQTGNANITWSLSNYNGSIAGTYTATGVLNMPYGWTSDAINISGTIVVRSNTATGEQTGVFEDNGHTYKFIPGRITWHEAKVAAESMFDNETGQRGYLATITSARENEFVAATLNGEGWLGGSDKGNEGTWLWVTGPEAGESIASYYSNFASGEPNNWGGDEDYLHMYSGGKWNDYKENNSQISGYVVEFGGMAVNNFANTGTSTTDTTVTFTWTQPAGAIGIKIQQSPAGANSWTDSNTGVIQVDSTIATVTGLTGATAYDFRLVVDGGANEGRSNIVRITTDATLVTAIAEISGSAIVGFELSAGAITPSNAIVEYQWKICDTANGTYNDIDNATTNVYTPVESDAKKFIKVIAMGTDSYTGTVTSAAVEVQYASNSAPTTPIITRNPSGSVLVTTPITITALSADPEGDDINYVWTGKLADGSTYPLGKNVVTVKAVDSRGLESAEAAIVFFVTDSTGGGVLLTGPNSRIYENGLEGATITHYTFNVPSVSGHNGADYAQVKGLNIKNQIWEQIEYRQVSNGVSLTKSLTPGVYSRLEFFYYASHCMYDKSNITYTVDYSFENFPSDASTEAAPVASNVTVTGLTTVGSTLTGAYTYYDANGDLEGYVDSSYNVISTSTYQWYSADDVSGTNKTAITSATTKTYTVKSSDNGKYLFFTVTPLAVTGTTGTTTGNMAQSNAVYIGTVEYMAAGITTIQAPARDATSLTLPTGAGVYTVAIKSSNNEDVIAINGTIIPPNEDTTVALVLTVTRTSDNTTADTEIINVVVPAKTIVVIKSTDASVVSIAVAGENATVESDDPKVYNVELPTETVLTDIQASDVVAIATDNNATVATPTSENGGATWTIEVTAEDGTTKAMYTVNVTVETELAETKAAVILSADASVVSIAVAGENATVENDDPKVYNVELPTETVLTDIQASDVVAIATENNATVATPTSENGGATWTVEVTAEDGTTKAMYTVNVTVETELAETKAAVILSADASVVSITVAGENTTVESDDPKVYNVELPTETVLTDIQASDIVVIVTDNNATVTVATTANDGVTWRLEVIAEDGTTKATYIVNVTVAQTVLVTDIITEGGADLDTITENVTLQQ